MKKISILLVFLAISGVLHAYPISPRPLRLLVIESEYIVWARVINTGTVKLQRKEENVWDRDYATIVINEILQGNLSSDTIRVYFCTGMVCPAPGVMDENEEALVFLDKRQKLDGYEIHALSYGVKHGLTQKDYHIYKTRIQEMQEILKSKDEQKCTDAIVDWLVKCAEQPCTRWEGVYELSPESDFMSFYDMNGRIPRGIFLNNESRQKLFDVLLRIDTLSYDDMGLVDIALGMHDSLLLEFLKSKLIVDVDYFWIARAIMSRIVTMTDDLGLSDIASRGNDIYYASDDKEREQIKQILSDFIERMKNKKLKLKVRSVGPNDT